MTDGPDRGPALLGVGQDQVGSVQVKLVADATVSPATRTATWINREGRRIFEVRRTATELGHPA